MRKPFLCLALGACAALPVSADESRFTEPVTLHDYHPFREFGGPGKWDGRREQIRSRIKLAAGILPFPEKTPLNAKRFGAVERDGFRVERVYFESFPGHYVTGSLFLPTGESLERGLRDGKRPGVLCPHGHWKNGRFYDAGIPAALQYIAQGAERFETAGRNPIISRSVQLARMGCVVFAYDMLGNADSVQFEEHRRGPRDEMNSPEKGKWGFVSPRATLRLQSNFGLQTWNSVRAVDFLETVEGVDPERLLVTGASGGATQTMILAGVDDRIDAAFPAVMVSTAMQGGCTCENACYLRIGQGNIDIGAALAPKPLGLTAADDWTIELETKGHPDLVKLYEGLGKPKNYEAHFDIHFKHNYNHVSRTHMYSFVNRHFGLGLKEPVLESDYEFLGPEELTVWPGGKKPEGYLAGAEHERAVNEAWADLSDGQLAAALEDPDGNPWLRRAWETILRADDVRDTEASFVLGDKTRARGVIEMSGTVSGNSSPFAVSSLHPEDWNGEVLIRLGGKGEKAEPAQGVSVLVPTLYGQGNEEEVNRPTTYSGKKVEPDSWQRSPVYFYGYNDSVFVRRVHDLVSVVAMVRQHPKWDAKKVVVEAEGSLAAVALAAKVILGDGIDVVKADAGDFDFADVDDLWSEDMVPGAQKYGGVEGLRVLAGE